jgi:beta-phosphoglucomutase-like phosphatase (HAD superfamily)
VLGLPPHVTACLFDLDGVLTQTALVHNAAWKQTFDTFLQTWYAQHGQAFVPFDPGADYHEYVDGRPRADGVRTFLASRGITVPEGSPDDGPDAETVNGIGNRKNELVLRKIAEGAVQVYAGSVEYLHAAKAAGLRRAVVSASANCKDVLEAAGIADLIEARVDGVSDTYRASRPRTRSSTARSFSTRPPRSAPSSRTLWPAWPPVVQAVSGSWSVWTAWDRPRRWQPTVPTSSSRICPNS